jgi:hypothetical protein
MGLPVLQTLSLCTCCRQYPGAAAERRLRSFHPAVSAFPEIAVGSACTSSFSRLARRSLALRPAHSRRHLYVTRYTEGFSHFVTSMTAPVASGWSVRRVGLSPTGKRRLLTAHANSGHCPRAKSNSLQLPMNGCTGRKTRRSCAELRAHAVRAEVCGLHRRHSSLSNEKAGYAVTPLDRVRRNPMKPSAAKPASNIAQVEGSGTEDVSDTLSAKP